VDRNGGVARAAPPVIWGAGLSIHVSLAVRRVLDVGSGAECGLGTNYCPLTPNSAGAVPDASGSASVAANNLVLGVSGVAPNEPGVFIYGSAAIQAPFGEGKRCAGGAGVVRLWPPSFAGPGGGNYRALDNTSAATVTSPSPIVSATTLYFQYWFRDPPGGGTGFNLSDGLEITFGP